MSADLTGTCRKCGLSIDKIQGTWVVAGGCGTAEGLSYCPPDPDRANGRLHVPGKGTVHPAPESNDEYVRRLCREHGMNIDAEVLAAIAAVCQE